MKFVIHNLPFAHAVVAIDPEIEWKPSPQFLELAWQYDAIIPGDNNSLNTLIIENSLSRARHRPLIVVGGGGDFGRSGAIKAARDQSSITLVEATPNPDSLLRELARLKATSVLMLPNRINEQGLIERVDKLTVIAREDAREIEEASRLILSEADASAEEFEIWDASGAIELTGYAQPRA